MIGFGENANFGGFGLGAFAGTLQFAQGFGALGYVHDGAENLRCPTVGSQFDLGTAFELADRAIVAFDPGFESEGDTGLQRSGHQSGNAQLVRLVEYLRQLFQRARQVLDVEHSRGLVGPVDRGHFGRVPPMAYTRRAFGILEQAIAGGDLVKVSAVTCQRQRHGQGRDQQRQQIDLQEQDLLFDRGEELPHRAEIEDGQHRPDRGDQQEGQNGAAQADRSRCDRDCHQRQDEQRDVGLAESRERGQDHENHDPETPEGQNAAVVLAILQQEEDHGGHDQHAQGDGAHPRRQENRVEIARQHTGHQRAGGPADHGGSGKANEVQRPREQHVLRLPAAHQAEHQPAFDQIGNSVTERSQRSGACAEIGREARNRDTGGHHIASAGIEMQQRGHEDTARGPDGGDAVGTLGKLQRHHGADEPRQAIERRPAQFGLGRNLYFPIVQVSPLRRLLDIGG